MCLIFFSYDMHPRYQFILAANRDEFYERPTAPLDFWEDAPYILAGRDLRGKGTWMGITRTGRFAAITNFRDPASIRTDAPSRGLLLTNFLTGDESPQSYLESVSHSGNQYKGFNLLVGNGADLFYYSNRGHGVQKVRPGFYGLSNHLLDTPWPKVRKGKDALNALFSEREIRTEAVFRVLGDQTHPPDSELPDTGMGLEWERILSPLFVTSQTYGTRSSSVLLVERDGEISVAERTFVPVRGDLAKQQDTRRFCFYPGQGTSKSG